MRTPSGRALRDLAIGISLANLWLFSVWGNLFLVGTRQGYWLKLSNTDFLAAILNLLLLGALFSAAATLARRSASPRLWAAAQLAFLVALVPPLNFARRAAPGILSANPTAIFSGRTGLAIGVVLAAGGAFLLWRWRDRVARAAAVVVLVLSPYALMNAARAVWTVYRYNPSVTLADRFEQAAPPRQESSLPRTMLVVFDELDQRLAFADRPADVQLPVLDRLRRESLAAERAYPPADQTLMSIPALLTGIPVDSARPVGPRDLRLTFAGGERASWSRFPGLFADTHVLGGRVGVVGWNHPYCRIFQRQLARCSWQATNWRPRESDPGVLALMAAQLSSISPLGPREALTATYGWMIEEAKDAARDPALDLVYIHLPIPHSPYIYDRGKQSFSLTRFSHSAYLDNLVLADRAMGELRTAMEAAGLWNTTNVLVTSDHFWRDAELYDGTMDYRVPFILKLAGQTQTLVYHRPFNTVVARDLLEAVLSGELMEARAVVGWLDQYGGRVDTLGIYPMHRSQNSD